MKRILFGILCGCLLSLSTQGQLLWRVSGPSMSQPSYLFGTFHLTCKDQFWVDDSVRVALKQVKGLVLELNMRDPALMSDFIQSSRLPAGTTLLQDWPNTKKDSFSVALKQQYKLDAKNYETLQPMVLMSALYPKILNCPTASYELFLMEEAQKLQLSLTGLEKASDQMKAMGRIPLSKQMESVYQMVLDPAHSRKEFDELWQLYQTKRIEELFVKTSEDPQLGAYQEYLLDERNRNWVDILPTMMAEKPVFIAVGAGHLGGKQGVIRLLRAKGYRVEPVN